MVIVQKLRCHPTLSFGISERLSMFLIKLFYFIILCYPLFPDDIHLWISSFQDHTLELSIKSEHKIYGFDFYLNPQIDENVTIDFDSTIFSNGNIEVESSTISIGDGAATLAGFTCFTDGMYRVIGLSLEDNYIPITDSTIFMTIPISGNLEEAHFLIQDPLFISKNNENELIELDVEYGLIEYQDGWPFTNTDKIIGAPAIEDLDQNGEYEVIFSDYSGRVYITDRFGTLLNYFDTGDHIWGSPSIMDIDFDGLKEIVITSKDQHLYILDHQATLLLDYDAGQYLLGTPAIGNLDSDEDMEIIFGGYSSEGKLFAINIDGSDVNGFPIIINEKIQKGVALADFNLNGFDDIVFGTDDGNLYLVYDNGEIGFVTSVNDDIRSAPSIVNMNSQMLILVGSRDDNLYGINHDGSIRFAKQTGSKVDSSPMFIEYNSFLHIYFGSSDGYLYGIDSNGNDLPGWPIMIGNAIESSCSSSDFNGDNIPEIVVSTVANDLHIYRIDGSAYTTIPLVFEFPFSGCPSIIDIDQDQDLEIFVGSTNSMIAVDIKDINGSTEGYWNHYRGNLYRQGYFEVDINLFNSNINMFEEFKLYDVFPNPFNPTTLIEYQIANSGNYKLTIHDIQGRQIEVIKNGFHQRGLFSVTWDAEELSSGQYFVNLSGKDVSLTKKLTLIK